MHGNQNIAEAGARLSTRTTPYTPVGFFLWQYRSLHSTIFLSRIFVFSARLNDVRQVTEYSSE